jgi:hypothetical protein
MEFGSIWDREPISYLLFVCIGICEIRQNDIDV